MESEPHMELDLYNHMPVVIEGTSPQLLSESHLRPNFFQLNSQNDRMIGLPVGNSFKDLHAGKGVSYDELLNRDNFNHQELCSGGTSFSSDSVGMLLTCKNGPSSDENKFLVPLQELASDSFRVMYPSSDSYAPSSSVPSSLLCGYDSLVGDANNRWDQNRFLMQSDLNWRTSTSRVEPIRYSEIQDANEWDFTNSTTGCSSHAYGILRSQNELSLSLATAGPSFPCPESIQEQCSEIEYSSIFHGSQSQRRVGTEHTQHSSQRSQCNKELSLGCASSSQSAQFSQLIAGSRYRAVLKQILSELSTYSLDSVDHTNYSAGNFMSSSSNIPFSSDQFGTDGYNDNEGSIEAPGGSSGCKQELESKKSQLLSLLQVVDDQYNRCLDQIHTVISAFHAATELEPQLHASFALQSVSLVYKSLRQRISNQILEMGMGHEGAGDSSRSFEKSFIQKQWALQQLKKKDQQLWKPQRGLPERSVSVLRAWMFDNFLHPYPKDAEKHLLAIKSGLSRSQVSNWFINARVRLWKPLVEEMCAELNRRKNTRQNDKGSNDSTNISSQLSIYDFN